MNVMDSILEIIAQVHGTYGESLADKIVFELIEWEVITPKQGELFEESWNDALTATW